jgi:hypothetical protein
MPEHAIDAGFFWGGPALMKQLEPYGELSSKIWAALLALLLVTVNAKQTDHKDRRENKEDAEKKTIQTTRNEEWKKVVTEWRAADQKRDEAAEQWRKKLYEEIRQANQRAEDWHTQSKSAEAARAAASAPPTPAKPATSPVP